MAITEFGKLVRDIREDLGVSLREMATDIGLSSTYVSAVEIGDKGISPEFLAKVTGFLRGKKIPLKTITTIHAAADRTMRVLGQQRIDVSSLDTDTRGRVAAFARKVADMDEREREKFLRKVEGLGGNS